MSALLTLVKTVVLVQVVAVGVVIAGTPSNRQSDEVKCTATCGMCSDVRQDGGTIVSPDYPKDYGNNRDCVITIEAPVGKQIEIMFYALVVESCCDLLTVTDGTNPYRELSGKHSMTAVTVPSNIMKIRFTSNEDNASLLAENLGPGRWVGRFTII